MPQPKRPTAPWIAVAAVVIALVLPAAAAANLRPDASFSFSPSGPSAGDTVTFSSSSCDPDGRLRQQAWDLDGDGKYDDARGSQAAQTYPAQGIWPVGLRVTDRGGRRHVRRISVPVTEYALPAPPRLLSPFPVVRLAGRVTGAGTQVRVLSIRAPVCARVTVICRGGGCPARRTRARVGRRPLRLRSFRRRTLGSGTVLQILIRKGDRVGKYTRFRIRDGRRPARLDRCLLPDAKTGSRCPAD